MKPKKIALASVAALLLAFLATPSAFAQQGSFELALGASLASLDNKLGGDTGAGVDFRIGYFVTDRLELEIQSAYASSILEGSFAAHTLNVVYHFEVEGDSLPYVLVGAGTADVQLDALFVAPIEDDGTALRAAVGGRFEIGQLGRSFARAEISALSEDSFNEDATHFSISVLWGWNFGS